MTERTITCPACNHTVTYARNYCYCGQCGHQLQDAPLIALTKRFFADVSGFQSVPLAGITPTMIDDYREQFAEIGIDIDAPVLTAPEQ